MCSPLYNTPVIEKVNHVSVDNGVQPVAMAMVVRPFIAVCSAPWTNFSEAASRAEVASSSRLYRTLRRSPQTKIVGRSLTGL